MKQFLIASPLAVLALGPVAPLVAQAERFMSEDEAAAAIFPGEKFTQAKIELTEKDVDAIRAKSDERVRSKQILVLRSAKKNTVIVDQVLGKHEYITYAVGIREDGTVAGIEIIDYRESYGHQVRKPEWRAQFHDKDASATLRVDKDIKNISGATLSSVHVTGGVRRLLATYAEIRERI